jgi:hypothetical protein
MEVNPLHHIAVDNPLNLTAWYRCGIWYLAVSQRYGAAAKLRHANLCFVIQPRQIKETYLYE